MKLGPNQLKMSICILRMESENNSILINTPTNYEGSSAYSPEKGFGAYQGNEYGGYGVPSGLHPDYGMRKRSSTIRHTSSPQVAMSAVGQTNGKPPTVKSTRKPPKAPRELQMHHPQDLSSKFKPEEISSKEDEKESPSVSDVTSKSPIKKNAEIEEPEKKLNLKKVQPPAGTKKMLNSEKQLLKTKNKLQGRGSKLNVDGKEKVKARERKENLLILGNVSFEESGDGESSSESYDDEDDDLVDVRDKPIETIGDLLQIFGGRIESELDNELHIRVPNSDNVVKVPKNIFSGL